MSVDQATSRRSERSRDGSKVVRYHDYIDEKIEGTRRMVKVVDLATALVELAVAVLLFLLFTIVVEHWVVPGGLPSSVRAVLFLILASGVGFFVVRRLWPLCVRGINPVYAAHAIEQGSRTLKNGLVNLLLFRQKRTEISDAVYHTLEEQAAHGLTRVSVDTTVDRTELIRLGYLLIAIVAVAAGYKVLSPKDPLVAAERVLMPWADIVPASRVAISEIKPGTETVSQGEPVDVSAAVHGLTENDTVTLRYTTEDGQIVSRGIPMKASPDGLQFVARLADDAERGTNAGVTRNLRYRIEAGDARSLEYALTVVPAATIVIERVDYHYPAYTGYLDRSAEGAGDIRAIEGTKITIHARANGVIREANVDFDADGRPDLQMSTQDAKAHASFELGLREDRQTPLHASYVLRFANAEGRSNHDPIKYSINVDPDRQPEVELRTPEEKSRDAQVNESVAIEIAARDPDFSLAAVRLRGEVGGREVLNEAVLKAEQKGQFNGRYALVPSAHELKEGDVLEYWAEAEDNRAPKPNSVSTEHKALRIVSTKQGAQGRANQGGQNGQKQPQQGDKGQDKSQQNGGQKGSDQSGDSGQQKSDGQSGQGQSKDGQGQGQGQQGDEKGQGGNPQPGQSGGEQQSGGGDQKQSGDMKEQKSGSGQSDHANEHGGQGQSQSGGGGQTGSKEQSPNKPDQQQQGDQQNGAGGEQSKDGGQPNGAKPDAKSVGNKGQSQSGGQSQKNQQQNGQQGDQQQSNDSQPVSSEGDNDAEAFNRIQKRMEQNGEIKPNESSKKDNSQGDKGQAGEKSQQGGSNQSGEKNQAGDQQGQKGDDKQEAEKSGSKEQNGKSADKANSQQSQQDGSKQGAKEKALDSKQGDAKQQEKKQGDSQEKQQAPGGEQNPSSGSGTSANDEKKQGSPQSQSGKKPTDKPDQAGSKGDKSDQQEPASGASGKRESDSHGDQGGDKSGGGAEGSGQKSPHDGTGSSGQNQSADSGAGQSGEQGKGDTSSKGGKDEKSDHPTGSSDGKTPGKGSGQKDGAGDKPGGQSGEKQDANGDKSSSDGKGQKNEQGDGKQQGSKQQGDNARQKPDSNQGDKATADKSGDKNVEKQSGDQSPQKSNEQNQNNDSGSNKGGSSGAGQPGGAVNPQVSITGEAPEGDAANLEYARKQTDLVVNKLADQLNSKKVDPALLKELGWSQDDLKRFVDRWQKRKEAADQNGDGGDAAKRELDDALRSLGLRPGEMKQNAVQKDTMRDLHEGYRGPVPAEYKDRLRAYNQGVSRAKKDGE